MKKIVLGLLMLVSVSFADILYVEKGVCYLETRDNNIIFKIADVILVHKKSLSNYELVLESKGGNMSKITFNDFNVYKILLNEMRKGQ
jgi:hypothetical protein